MPSSFRIRTPRTAVAVATLSEYVPRVSSAVSVPDPLYRIAVLWLGDLRSDSKVCFAPQTCYSQRRYCKKIERVDCSCTGASMCPTGCKQAAVISFEFTLNQSSPLSGRAHCCNGSAIVSQLFGKAINSLRLLVLTAEARNRIASLRELVLTRACCIPVLLRY